MRLNDFIIEIEAEANSGGYDLNTIDEYLEFIGIQQIDGKFQAIVDFNHPDNDHQFYHLMQDMTYLWSSVTNQDELIDQMNNMQANGYPVSQDAWVCALSSGDSDDPIAQLVLEYVSEHKQQLVDEGTVNHDFKPDLSHLEDEDTIPEGALAFYDRFFRQSDHPGYQHLSEATDRYFIDELRTVIAEHQYLSDSPKYSPSSEEHFNLIGRVLGDEQPGSYHGLGWNAPVAMHCFNMDTANSINTLKLNADYARSYQGEFTEVDWEPPQSRNKFKF